MTFVPADLTISLALIPRSTYAEIAKLCLAIDADRAFPFQATKPEL
jgi:hypothetical protein